MILDHLGPFATLPANKPEASKAFKNISIDEAELHRCGHFEHGLRTRIEIAKADAWIMLAIFWDNMQSPIHDHESSDCGFHVIAGVVEETRYKLIKDDLVKPVATRILTPGESAKSAGESIHTLGVPKGRSGQAITLHLYCPILGYDAMGIYREVDSVDEVVVKSDKVTSRR